MVLHLVDITIDIVEFPVYLLFLVPEHADLLGFKLLFKVKRWSLVLCYLQFSVDYLVVDVALPDGQGL